VSLPNQIEKEGSGPPLQVTSPPMHPAVRRIAGTTKGKEWEGFTGGCIGLYFCKVDCKM